MGQGFAFVDELPQITTDTQLGDGGGQGHGAARGESLQMEPQISSRPAWKEILLAQLLISVCSASWALQRA